MSLFFFRTCTLSQTLREFLEAPMPCILGMRAEDLPPRGSAAAARLLVDMVLVDVDRGIVGGALSEMPALPVEPLSKLFTRLRSGTRAALVASAGLGAPPNDARAPQSSRFDTMKDGTFISFVCLCSFVCTLSFGCSLFLSTNLRYAVGVRRVLGRAPL